MDLHRRGELRSIAYHRAIAQRLARDPALVSRAGERLDAWVRAGVLHAQLADAWRTVLALPLEELGARLVADDEPMQRLRSVSPFAGELSARERWSVWREGRARP